MYFYSVKFLFLDSYQISCVILSSVTRLLILGVDFSFVSFPLRVPKYGYFTIKPRLLSACGKTLKSPLGGDISSLLLSESIGQWQSPPALLPAGKSNGQRAW